MRLPLPVGQHMPHPGGHDQLADIKKAFADLAGDHDDDTLLNVMQVFYRQRVAEILSAGGHQLDIIGQYCDVKLAGKTKDQIFDLYIDTFIGANGGGGG